MNQPDKILIVDDDELILHCMERVLRKRFNVETALGPKEALEFINKRGPYAVVLSDMRMPGLSGMELLEKVKELSPASVRLILTGNVELTHESPEALGEDLVFKVIQKPCEPEELVKVLDEALLKSRQDLLLQNR